MELRIGDVWHGRAGTVYEGVSAKIEAITARRVQVTYDRIVEVNGMRLRGQALYKRAFLGVCPTE